MTDDNASFQSDREDAMSKDSKKDKTEKLSFDMGPVIDELAYLRHPWGTNEKWRKAHGDLDKQNEKIKRDAERDTQ